MQPFTPLPLGTNYSNAPVFKPSVSAFNPTPTKMQMQPAPACKQSPPQHHMQMQMAHFNLSDH